MTTTKIYNRNTHDKDVKPCTFPQFQTVNCDDFIPSYRHSTTKMKSKSRELKEIQRALAATTGKEKKINHHTHYIQSDRNILEYTTIIFRLFLDSVI